MFSSAKNFKKSVMFLLSFVDIEPLIGVVVFSQE